MALPKNKLPTFTTTIPSTGELIRFVPYTNADEKILLTAAEGGDVFENIHAVKDIIKLCYINIDTDKLTSYDIDYLFLQLRIQSVSNISEQYFRSMQCNKTGGECEKTIKLSINLSDITVQKYDEDEEKYVDYKVDKTKNGAELIKLSDSIGVSMKHPGFDTQLKYSEMVDPSEDDLVKLCIVNVYDDETVYTKDDFSDEDLNEFYASLLPIQIDKMRKFIRNIPKVRYESQFVCKECGFTEPLLFEDFESFFG
jgi:hypothetical protein